MIDTNLVSLGTVALAAIAPTVLAVATLISSLHNGQKASTANDKADLLVVKAGEIHQNTNGTLSALRADLAAANRKIAALEWQLGASNAS
jgi:hypothetical protein